MSTHHHLLELIERLGNLLRGEQRQLGQAHGLQPVHWQALDYLARCNAMSDTPLALAQYLGVSKGTASQSVLVLQNKRLIEKSTDQEDRRVVHLHLTAQGRKALAGFGHQAGRERVVAGLGAAEQDSADQALTALLKGLLAQQGGKSFGVCHTCRYFEHEGSGFRCGLIGVPLSAAESEKICHEHQYP